MEKGQDTHHSKGGWWGRIRPEAEGPPSSWGAGVAEWLGRVPSFPGCHKLSSP